MSTDLDDLIPEVEAPLFSPVLPDTGARAADDGLSPATIFSIDVLPVDVLVPVQDQWKAMFDQPLSDRASVLHHAQVAPDLTHGRDEVMVHHGDPEGLIVPEEGCGVLELCIAHAARVVAVDRSLAAVEPENLDAEVFEPCVVHPMMGRCLGRERGLVEEGLIQLVVVGVPVLGVPEDIMVSGHDHESRHRKIEDTGHQLLEERDGGRDPFRGASIEKVAGCDHQLRFDSLFAQVALQRRDEGRLLFTKPQ